MENKYYVKDISFRERKILWSVIFLHHMVFSLVRVIFDIRRGEIKSSIHIAVFSMVLFLLLLYIYKNALQNGLHIEGDSIYYKDIVRRKIKPEKIKGIKITKDTMPEGTKSYFVPRVDENGNYVYCMIFLKELYDDMRTYNRDHQCFSSEYHECIMFKTVYDLPAINRLRELIPDLVVMYEEE